MTTVAELIAYLQTLPPETTVDVLAEETAGYSSYSHWIDLELPDEYGCGKSMEFYDCISLGKPFLRMGRG